VLSALSLGDTHSCGLSETGEVWCWGDNQYGQVGVPDQEVVWIAQRVDLPFSVAQLSAGADHNCVRAVAGTVHCWGGAKNATGYATELDVDWEVIQPRNSHFEPVPGITNASWISSGDGYGCAVLGDSGEVMCWAGQLSLVTGSREYEGPEPRTIPDLPPIERVHAGSGYACAITHAGEAWCWGDNRTNQLGDDYPGWGVRSFSPVDRLDLEWGDGE
jgi:alpha-tubulin suppressor-like RCC1 family protein